MRENNEQQLQEALVKNFFSNLEFLKLYDNELFQRVENLSNAINSGLYEARFELEFLSEYGEFDILDLNYNKYLYNKKAKKFNHNIINSVKFDKDSTFSILMPELYSLKNKYQEVDLEYESYEEIEGIITNNIKEFTDISKDDLTKEKKFKYINKFVFLGTLLGRHFFDIKKKVNAQNYFVYEYNLEIFRLSLFTTNYEDLSKGVNLTFSIMDNETLLIRKFQLFLEKNMYENYNIKFATTNYNVSSGMHSIISTLYKINPAGFDYTRILHNLVKLSTQRINNAKILIPENNDEFQSIKDKPFLFIAPGPSLSKEMLWIKSNKNKFVIVAIGASYRKLLENDIVPDLLSSLEPSYKDLKKYQFNKVDTETLKNTIKLFSIMTPPQISDMFEDEDTFYYEVIYSLRNKNRVYKGHSVGEITVSLLLDLGIRNIYLIGTDLAVDKETGNTHFGYKNGGEINHNINVEYDITKNLSNNKTSYKEEIIPIEGNFEKEVYTTRIFINSIFSYEEAIKEYKKDNQTIKNLSLHGAKLNGTLPYRTNDINLKQFDNIDKVKFREELATYLSSFSRLKLIKNEIEYIKTEINYFKNVLIEIKNYENIEIKDFASFYDIMIDIENKIKLIGYPTCLNFLLESYFKFTNTYLCYHFNERKIKNELSKISKVKDIWLKQVTDLINDYVIYLEKIKK